MKGTKRKQKIFEDNTSVPQYYFDSGVIKKNKSQKLLILELRLRS